MNEYRIIKDWVAEQTDAIERDSPPSSYVAVGRLLQLQALLDFIGSQQVGEPVSRNESNPSTATVE